MGQQPRPGASGSSDAPAIPAPPWAGAQARRPRRGTRPPLDRDQIVAAALGIVDTEGVDALSLRHLAETLGVTAMALYWHVRDKAELLDIVGEAVLAEIEIPPARGDWRNQLADVHRSMYAGLVRHPNTVGILIGRARYGAGGLTLFERILTILLEAGFSAEAAFDAYSSLYLFTLGFMATYSRTPAFREIQRQGVLYMSSLPVERFPSIRTVVPVIGRRPPGEQFEIGLAVQIAGIATGLAPARRRRRG